MDMSSDSGQGIKRKADDGEDAGNCYIQTTPNKRPKAGMGSEATAIAQRPLKKMNPAAQNAAPVDDAPIQTSGRPWLTRPQTVSAQNQWLLHYRDNLVPGATGPKSGDEVTAAFNAKFQDELKKPLVWKTLQKRISTARKQFYVDNPEYEATIKYPPEIFDTTGAQQTQAGDANVVMQDEDETYASDQTAQELVQTPATPQNIDPALSYLQESSISPITLDATDVPSAPTTLSAHPGAPPFSLATISPIDRVRHHLRRRTSDQIGFCFENRTMDEHLQSLDDVQYLDHTLFQRVSSVYAVFAAKNTNMQFHVGEELSARMVNALIQLIAPVPAKHLPTHNLWHSRTAVDGEFDRFDNVTGEKIHWGVDLLMELANFATQIEVWYIVDMVIDRLHWMYLTQAKVLERCRIPALTDGGMPRFMGVSDTAAYTIEAGDFEEFMLNVVVFNKSTQTLTFVADLLAALGGAPKEWLEKQGEEVQDVFARAAGMATHLVGLSREEFCWRYHHHGQGMACYTTHQVPTMTDLIGQLYGTAPSAAVANVPQEVLDTEKMVLEMEMRVFEAKKAAGRARGAGLNEKKDAIKRAVEAAKGLFMASVVVTE